jgi:N6-adenosine-specific RNA methylase IME4
VLDKIGKFAGRSGKTVAKIAAICEAAKAEPEKYGPLLEAMDRTGRVDKPFRDLTIARNAEAIRKEPPALPGNGPYRVIVADPPWPYDRNVCAYPAMSIEQLCAMPVAALAHTDCVLWLWTTNAHMREAFDVLSAWGFIQKTILTWVKDRMGIGDWLRGQTEHCLMAARGKPTVQLSNQTTLLHEPVRAHSQKPEQFYEFIEKLCPAPRYAELFSRHSRPNWDGHGDEAGFVRESEYVGGGQ